MKSYVVLYRIEKIMSPLDSPFGFICMAEDTLHAEEQCQNAYPECDIVWAVIDTSYQRALDNYYDFA
jgi:hypothetical protein